VVEEKNFSVTGATVVLHGAPDPAAVDTATKPAAAAAVSPDKLTAMPGPPFAPPIRSDSASSAAVAAAAAALPFHSKNDSEGRA